MVETKDVETDLAQFRNNLARRGISDEGLRQLGRHREERTSAKITVQKLPDQEFLFFGTFAPRLRASERPTAMACLRLFTFPPLPPFPDFSVPVFLRCIALFTLLAAAFPYLRPLDFFVVTIDLLSWVGKKHVHVATGTVMVASVHSFGCNLACLAFVRRKIWNVRRHRIACSFPADGDLSVESGRNWSAFRFGVGASLCGTESSAKFVSLFPIQRSAYDSVPCSSGTARFSGTARDKPDT
jgi:hypothetical protein